VVEPTRGESGSSPADQLQLLTRARGGDERAFASLASGWQVSVFRHCYRMLGSGPEAEDSTQDSLLRAWQRLASYSGSGSLDGWVHRIATNLCIDRLRGRARRTQPLGLTGPAVPGQPPEMAALGVEWVEPVADHAIGFSGDPAHSALQRERISLAFVAALQRLSPRQRAALLLCDVLGFSQAEAGEVLASSESAVNNLLYRARLRIKAEKTPALADLDDPQVERLVARYVRAWERADITELVATVSADVRLSMPPLASWYEGAADVVSFVTVAIFGPTGGAGLVMRRARANGQHAVATYEPADAGSRVSGLQVLHIDAESLLISSITSFRDPELAMRCGFPDRAL
jgi:RNA polymerase sigma-70 factor (ECF subfamily)